MNRILGYSAIFAVGLATTSLEAQTRCYSGAEYVQARSALDSLPIGTRRAALDQRVAAAYSELEAALRAFIATQGGSCSAAQAAKNRADAAASTLVAITGSRPRPAAPLDDPWITFCLTTQPVGCVGACIDGLPDC